MKKNLEKIFASASIIVAVILIMILIVTVFGGIKPAEFESELVRGLFITLAILYLTLSVVALVLMFVRSDVVKDVVVRTEKGRTTRVSVKAIKSRVKQACLQINSVKFKKVALVQDDYGVRLKVNIKVSDEKATYVETALRILLEEIFLADFGFRFVSIDTKIVVVTPKSKESLAELSAIAEEKATEEVAAIEEACAEEAAQAEVCQVAEAQEASAAEVDNK